jgi:hypothetical protein
VDWVLGAHEPCIHSDRAQYPERYLFYTSSIEALFLKVGFLLSNGFIKSHQFTPLFDLDFEI